MSLIRFIHRIRVSGLPLLFLCMNLFATVDVQAADLTLNSGELKQAFRLDTQWNFEGPDQKNYQVKVPSSWESSAYHQRRPYFGKGTYTLTLNLPPESLGSVIKLYSPFIAGNWFRAYVNDRLIGHNGFYEGSLSRVTQFEPFKVEDTELKIRIEVYNHLLHWSGLVNSIWIGNAESIAKNIHTKAQGMNIIFGIFLFLAFFHLLLYLFYRKDRAMFWFSLLCFSVCLYMEFFSIHNLEYLFGDIPFEWSIKGMRLGLYTILPAFLWYVHSLSPKYLPLKFVQGMGVISVFFCFTVLLPGYIHAPLIRFWLLLLLACMVYNLYLSVKMNSIPDARPFVYSGLLFSVAALNDLFNGLGIIHTGYLGRFGVFAFCISQSVLLAWRLQKSYLQSLSLATELAAQNQNLEKLIASRTEEIEKKNNELNQLLSFKAEMVEMMAHDLKTPLNVLINASDHSQESQEQQSNQKKLVQDVGLRMQNLIEHMLSLNKNEEPDLQLHLETHSLSGICHQVIETLQSHALKKHIHLSTSFSADSRFMLDALLIERVIQNIVDNAIKQAPEHSCIQIQGYPQKSNYVFEVQDSGPGISSEIKEHIFEKRFSFSQVNAPKSTGLGLYFCKTVIQAHQGQIELLNAPGGGTIVQISFPLPVKKTAQMLHWKPFQIEVLKPLINKLHRLEVYEISKLKPILEELSLLVDPQMQTWAQALTEAIQDVNETNYRELIHQVAPHTDR